jgi:hypothetical protein
MLGLLLSGVVGNGLGELHSITSASVANPTNLLTAPQPRQ